MSQNYTYPPGFATSVNPSVGTNGSAAPVSSTQVGAKDPSNNLAALLVDSSGNLKVAVENAIGAPVNTSDAADGPVTPGTVASKSILIGLQYNTSLPTLSNTQQASAQADSSGRLIISPLTNLSIVKAQLQDNSGTAITLGQKTMSSSLPVAIASDQSAIPVSQSGTWNLNNISGTISLPTGASTSALQTQISGQLPTTLGQKTSANSLAVVIASDQSTLPVSGTVTANQGTANATPWNENVAQFGGSAVVTGTGASGSGIPRVTISNDSSLAANQSVNMNQVGGSSVTLGQKTSANSIPVVIASDQSSISLGPTTGRSTANAPVQNIYSSTNITTSAYTQLIASTTSTTNYLDIFDSSGQAMILGVGSPGSEVIQAYIPPGGDQIPLKIPSGSRVAYKALSANATSGYLLMNLYT